MTGPKIIAQASPTEDAARVRRESGIRQTPEGYIAVRDGKYVGTFRGKRGYLAATRAAGCSQRLSA